MKDLNNLKFLQYETCTNLQLICILERIPPFEISELEL
jgi:hypothetical protein